jgi:hypothetical protein
MTRLTQHAVQCAWHATGENYAGSAVCREVFRSACHRNKLRESLEVNGWTETGKRTNRWLCPAHKLPPLTMEAKYPTGPSSR